MAEQESKCEMRMIEGIPICGSNLTSVVTYVSNIIREIYYRIGDRLYIENVTKLEKRNAELENLVGNLLIAGYQV
jgi:hypothetical protein